MNEISNSIAHSDNSTRIFKNSALVSNLFPKEMRPNCKHVIIAGPCSAETEEQTLATARALNPKEVNIFRAGLWKPRTMPGFFEGVGEEGLAWLRRVREETGLPISTEVATPQHVEACLKAGLDYLWVGARTSANPFAMQELAEALRGVDNVGVMVKNPLNPDLKAWIGAIDRLQRVGIDRIGAIHRGFSISGPHIYRNSPLWRLPIELHRKMPDLPILVDPSHIAGRRDLVEGLCREAVDMGFDGLMIETHCNPDEAWSDAAQQLTPAQLSETITELRPRSTKNYSDQLEDLRKQVDGLDDELLEVLARRFEITDEIGRLKCQYDMPIVQTGRYHALMEDRVNSGAGLGLSPEFLRLLLSTIHEESVSRQTALK